jgi:hypothetical protein
MADSITTSTGNVQDTWSTTTVVVDTGTGITTVTTETDSLIVGQGLEVITTDTTVIAGDGSSVETVSTITVEVSKFFGLDINSPYQWPGTPPVPKWDSNGERLDQDQPIQYQSNPKYYYKWMRIIPGSGIGWVKHIYLPPGEETPIGIDRAITNGFEAVSAWCLFIQQPESIDCVVSLYTATTRQIVTTSTLQRANLIQILNCQTADFPEADPDSATLLETWPMTQGSAILDTGNNYFSVKNTGTATQILTSLGSFDQYDLKDVLESTTVATHRPFFINWSNNG